MTTTTPETLKAEVEALEKRIGEDKQRLAALRKQLPALALTQDYVFTTPAGGPRKLSELFGERDELVVIHNMGIRCSYCTMWADGFNGLLDHLRDRAAFVVTSPDAPEVQAKIKAGRGWRFELLSNQGTSFAKDMGFRGAPDLSDAADPDGESDWPGVSTFHKAADGTITRVAKAFFGPGDDFCATWHLFDLLPQGVNDWEPKLAYSQAGHQHGGGCCH